MDDLTDQERLGDRREGASAPSRSRSRTPTDTFRDGAAKYGLFAVLAVFVGVFSILRPDTFATEANFRSMINSQSIVLLLAIAATIVLRTGDFDLSIASVMTTTAATSAVLVRDGHSIVIVFVVALVVGSVVGFVNGFLVVKIGVTSFITTLGMSTALAGATFAITDSKTIFNLRGPLLSVARTRILDFPLRTWFGWALVAIAWYVYERTPLGRYLLFVGGSRESARLAGLKVDRIRVGAFVASALLAALTGVLLAGFLAGIDPSIGPGFLLQPFAAAFLGATAISIGRFNAIGTLAALYLLIVGITGLQLLGADTWVTDVFNGGALVVAVSLARIVGGRRGDS